MSQKVLNKFYNFHNGEWILFLFLQSSNKETID